MQGPYFMFLVLMLLFPVRTFQRKQSSLDCGWLGQQQRWAELSPSLWTCQHKEHYFLVFGNFSSFFEFIGYQSKKQSSALSTLTQQVALWNRGIWQYSELPFCSTNPVTTLPSTHMILALNNISAEILGSLLKVRCFKQVFFNLVSSLL